VVATSRQLSEQSSIPSWEVVNQRCSQTRGVSAPLIRGHTVLVPGAPPELRSEASSEGTEKFLLKTADGPELAGPVVDLHPVAASV
jgi:hypothetical protein